MKGKNEGGKLICGKCNSHSICRDDNAKTGERFITCRDCGNRYPPGEKPVFLEYEKEYKKNVIPNRPLDLVASPKKKRSAEKGNVPVKIDSTDNKKEAIVDLNGGQDVEIDNDNEDISEELLAMEQRMQVKNSDITAASVKKAEKYARPCENCGRTMLIQGNGLCGACRAVRNVAELNGKDVAAALAAAKVRYNSLQVKRSEREMQTRRVIILRFSGEDEKLYDKIIELAKENRREPAQQIFWMLEKQGKLKE